MNLKNKKIVVTGGAGFLGSHVVEELRCAGCQQVFVPRSSEFDLRRPEAVRRLYEEAEPHVLIHLAAIVGGIGANRANPGRFFYDNIMMGAEVMEQTRLRGVEKLVAVGTVCAYPKFTPVPFREDDLWNGYPEETNAPYGLAKKMLLAGAGLPAAIWFQRHLPPPGEPVRSARFLRPRDVARNPRADQEVRGCRGEQARDIEVWGIGAASREFLYVGDCARAIVFAAEHYDKPDPVNLGAGREIRIRELVEQIAELTGFHGEIVWDASKPDGQPRRCLDVSRAEREFGFRATTDFVVGLRNTIDWYQEEKRKLPSEN